MFSDAQIVARPDVSQLLCSLTTQEKEALTSALLAELAAEAKSRVISKQLGDSGLIVVLGGSSSSNIISQVQSASNCDIVSVLEALAQKIKG